MSDKSFFQDHGSHFPPVAFSENVLVPAVGSTLQLVDLRAEPFGRRIKLVLMKAPNDNGYRVPIPRPIELPEQDAGNKQRHLSSYLGRKERVLETL